MADQNAYARVLARAWSDPQFKQRLLAEPATVLKEAGVDLLGAETVRVHEDIPGKVANFILPAAPNGDLTVEHLEAVAAAGSASCSFSRPPNAE